MRPEIKTELPGPKSRAIIAQDAEFASPSYIKEYPLVADRGEGAWLYDVDGNKFLDMMAGIAVTATGYNHPKVVQAIKDSADKVWHVCATDFYGDPFSKLLAKLASYVPAMGKKRVFVTNSGTEAIEGAIKLVRHHTRRPNMIAFHGAFHGRSMGALSLTSSKVHHRAHFGPFLPGVVHAPYGDLEFLKEELFKRNLDPKEVAAIFVEPILGEGGYKTPPPGFLKGLREICDTHGILLVFDEIQTGVGRTGAMYAAEYFDVAPDVICTAKGLGSGMPIGAIIAKESVMTWARATHGSTYGGNFICCAAALATLEIVEEMLPQIREVGAILTQGLKRLQTKYSQIVDVRGPGLMIGMELASPQLMADLEQLAFRRGLLLLGCGTSTIRFAPPLVITPADVQVGLQVLDECLRELTMA